ncbi:hypothetical protein IAU59_002300 [Kwoniella sp. CBS 9459]
MGNCFSDPSSKPHKQSQGQVLGCGPSRNNGPPGPAGQAPVQGGAGKGSTLGRNSEPPRTLGGGSVVSGGGSGSEDPRERALRAAEERAKAAQGKGVNASNPKAGQLSAKLAAENRKVSSPNQNDERLMDKGQWN